MPLPLARGDVDVAGFGKRARAWAPITAADECRLPLSARRQNDSRHIDATRAYLGARHLAFIPKAHRRLSSMMLVGATMHKAQRETGGGGRPRY